ncbi:hypothetical protein [Methylobacterium sp. CM6247]
MHPRRDLHVGAQAKAAAVIGMLAPRLTDRIMGRIMYDSYQSLTRRSSGSRARSLFEAGCGGQKRGTHEPHLLRGRSLYVQVSKRPVVTTAAVAAALLLGFAVRKRMAR